MYNYGYDYNTGYSSYDASSTLLGGIFASMGIMLLISSAIGILMLISQWKIYKKAGKKGWECLIPIYNIIVLLEIVELPLWYIALFFVPFANIYASFKIFIELAHKFGKSTGFGVLTVFFRVICLPILAFGKDNVYKGGNNVATQNNQYNPNNLANFQTPQPDMTFTQNVNNNINPIPTPVTMSSPIINPEPVQTVNEPLMMPQQPFVNQTVNNIEQPIINNVGTTNINTTIPEPVEQVIPTPVVNMVPEVNINQNVTPVAEEQNINNPVNTINEPVIIPQPPVMNPTINNFNNQNNQNM